MIKLIIGKKGTGKTKTLIDLVNRSLETTKGDVACIEKGKGLNHDINYRCRLIDVDEYKIKDAQALYGFIAGILASNHDITDLFIDATMRICNFDMEAFDQFLLELDYLSEYESCNFVVSATLDESEASETVKKYL